MNHKGIILGFIGAAGSAIANFFGGWTSDLATLLIFMGIDFITGLIVAGIFNKSTKSKNGALDSQIGFKGIAKKVMILLFVLIGHRVDLLIGCDYVRTAVIIAFIVNEFISITENAGLMGIPVPKPLLKAIDILKGRSEDNEQQ